MLVTVLVTKVPMKLAVFEARQSICVRIGMFIAESIMVVVMLVVQLLVLLGMLPVALITPILIVGHRRYGNSHA